MYNSAMVAMVGMVGMMAVLLFVLGAMMIGKRIAAA